MSDIIVGSVGVQLVPSAKGFPEKARAELKGLTADVVLKPITKAFQAEMAEATRPRTVKVTADTSGAKAEIAKLRGLLTSKTLELSASTAQARAAISELQAKIASTKASLQVNADDAAAKKALAELQAQLKAMRTKLEIDTAPARLEIDTLKAELATKKVTINAEANTAAANAQIDYAARPRVAKINADDGGSFGKLIILAGVLGSALVPLTASVAGLGLALGAPIAAGVGGATVFGLLAGKNISNIDATQKKIDALLHTAATTTSKKTYDSSIAQAKELQDSLTGQQKAFLGAKEALSSAFKSLSDSTGKALFAPVIAGLTTLRELMPSLAPIIRSVSKALTGIIQSIGQSAQSGALKSFLDFLGKNAGPVLTTFATILGNIGAGFAGMFAAFAPVGAQLGSALVDLTEKFANFGATAGQNSGFQGFIAYIQQVGPQVAATIGQVVVALVHVGTALAPFGGVILSGIGLLASAINAIPIPVLTVLAAVIGTVVVGLKLWAAIQAVLNVLLTANPIGVIVLAIAGLVTGLILAYKHSATFRTILNAIAAAVKNLVVPALKFLLNAFLTLVGAILKGAAKAFRWIPGIGPKLKAAAADFEAFKNAANESLSNIIDGKTITIRIGVIETGASLLTKAVTGAVGSGGTQTLGAGLVSGGLKGGTTPVKTPTYGGGGAPAFSGGGGGSKPKKPKLSDAAKLLIKQRKEAASLLNSLNQGVNAGGTKLLTVLGNIRSHLVDLPKGVRVALRAMVDNYTDALKALTTKLDAAKEVLKGLQDQYADIASSIADAFTPDNLFGGTLAQLGSGLKDALANIAAAGAAQQKLIAAGVSASFVTALLASGNTALITEASNNLDLARQYGNQYAQVTSTAKGLGDVQANAQLGDQMAKANQTLLDINKSIKQVGHDVGISVGTELNGIATAGATKGGTHR